MSQGKEEIGSTLHILSHVDYIEEIKWNVNIDREPQRSSWSHVSAADKVSAVYFRVRKRQSPVITS